MQKPKIRTLRFGFGENLDLRIIERKEGDEGVRKTNGRYLRREFAYSKFQQTLILPDDVEKEHISAGVADGVLTITLPKQTAEDKAKATRQIEIK